ncbi:cyclic nucleotide-binding domain-containing protein [Andreprevotia chitinilytica]|uniref:cyclic nucleotide-binding domain-containing protein n=1 Tax=Andreprevotia chitinilytica TaxID=396808 RepID=UPI000691F60C|nr:cyclic nucleotide-binding domain-containing protein [Andreprevotia chitinilytica]
MFSDDLLLRLRTRVALLRDFSIDEVGEFVGHCRPETQPAGHCVVREGEPGRSMYIVVAGTLSVQRLTGGQQVQLAVLEAGDTFGELALLDFGERSASVLALTEVRLLQFERGHMVGIPALQPKLYRNLALMLAERLRETNQLVGSLASNRSATAAETPRKRTMVNR